MPNIMAPTAMPIELMAPIQPICPADRPQSAFSAARMKDSRPTSMASNIQPRPEVTSRRFFDTGGWPGAATVAVDMAASPEGKGGAW